MPAALWSNYAYLDFISCLVSCSVSDVAVSSYSYPLCPRTPYVNIGLVLCLLCFFLYMRIEALPAVYYDSQALVLIFPRFIWISNFNFILTHAYFCSFAEHDSLFLIVASISTCLYVPTAC